MSSRALRKIGGGKNELQLPKQDEEDEEGDDSLVDVRNTGTKPKMANPFNLVSFVALFHTRSAQIRITIRLFLCKINKFTSNFLQTQIIKK